MSRRLPARIVSVTALVLISAGTVLAQAHGAETAAEHKGLPQLNPDVFSPQLVWLAIGFITLYRLLSKKALPLVAEVLEERQGRITGDLDRAASAKNESQTILTAYEQALAEARGQAQAAIGSAVAETTAANARRQAEVVADIAARTKAAEQRIEAARQQALANIRGVAVEITQTATARLAGIDIDAATADKAVATVLEERG